MNKKLLSVAVVAAMAGGAVTTAQAVHVNPDGLGQALIYPFYSVEGGNDTYISVVNTTNATKAVKVRVLEGMNSQEVIDFNLYLSPYDVWTGVITRGTGDAAVLRTADTSCTVPAIPAAGVAFRDFQYTADSVRGLERTREGYIELLEMGEIFNVDTNANGFRPADWIKHNSAGVPANCTRLVEAWSSGGNWSSNPNLGVLPAAGGLYGYGVLMNVQEGTAASYDAVAFDNFWNDGQFFHTNPGTTIPSLQSGRDVATVIDGANLYEAEFASGRDAVSATIMQASIMNDYVVSPEINASTDWVVTFPTKRFYTNFAWNNNGTPAVPAVAPFTAHWSRATSQACEPVVIDYWDREEREERVTDVDFSPSPAVDPISLCKEVNVISFNDSNVLNASDRVGANVSVAFNEGWMRIGFQGTGRAITSVEGIRFEGLPVVGFATQKYVNGNMGGLLSNYGVLVNHKSTRLISE